MNGLIKNTHRGFVNRDGIPIGFYRTVGCSRKCYVQDEYVDLVKTLYKKK